jgi:hypothetical protein
MVDVLRRTRHERTGRPKCAASGASTPAIRICSVSFRKAERGQARFSRQLFGGGRQGAGGPLASVGTRRSSLQSGGVWKKRKLSASPTLEDGRKGKLGASSVTRRVWERTL